MENISEHEMMGFRAGVNAERERIIALAETFICFDHKADLTCDHGGCWALQELIRKVRRLTDGDA